MSGTPALQARHLSVQLGGRPVLHAMDLAIAPGRWTCIVGPNGAGKSTLLKALAGLLPAQGDLRLLGRPLAGWSRRERACQLAWLGQGQEAATDLSVHDLVMLGRLPHQGWQAQPSAQDGEAVARALAATDMAALRDRPVGELSAGERQRALLARALAVDAPVLLMDEPLANLDPQHQAGWWQLVRSLVGQGRTVVTVLHEMSMALQADALLVLQGGRLLHQGLPGDAATHAALEQVFEHSLLIQPFQGQWVALPRPRVP